MPGISVGWRIVAGAALVGVGVLLGRGLGWRRRDLLYLTGLRNGQTALAVGPSSVANLAAMARMLSPDGHLVEIILDDMQPVADRNADGVRLTSRLVCEPSRAPFRQETFDAIVLVDPRWVEALIPLLRPAGVLSLVQIAGRGFRPAANRRNQLSEAGLEIIDSPGSSFSYVINARRPIETEVAR